MICALVTVARAYLKILRLPAHQKKVYCGVVLRSYLHAGQLVNSLPQTLDIQYQEKPFCLKLQDISDMSC